MNRSILFLVAMCVGMVVANPDFAVLFPNAGNVPCPISSVGCNETTNLCVGVGHGNTSTSYCGVTEANGFVSGSDLAAQLDFFGNNYKTAQLTWTQAVCLADYDLDGVYNGLELGDPCCVWKYGAIPRTSVGLSHPGNADSVTANPSCYGLNASAPSAPTGVRAPNLRSTTGYIYWDAPTSGCFCGYQIEWDHEILLNYTTSLNNLNTSFDISLMDVEASTNYTFRVRAVNLNLLIPGEWSDPFIVQTRPAGEPGALDSAPKSTIGVGLLTLIWQRPLDDGGDGGNSSVDLTYDINFENTEYTTGNVTYTWTGLLAGTYVVWFRVTSEHGSSPYTGPYVYTVEQSPAVMLLPFWTVFATLFLGWFF